MTTATLTTTQCDYPYVATCVRATVAWADTLDDLISAVFEIHEIDHDECVALWQMPGLLVGYVAPNGSLVELCYREPNPPERLARE